MVHGGSWAKYNLAEPIPLQVEHVAVEFVEPFRPSGPCLRTMKISAQWCRVDTSYFTHNWETRGGRERLLSRIGPKDRPTAFPNDPFTRNLSSHPTHLFTFRGQRGQQLSWWKGCNSKHMTMARRRPAHTHAHTHTPHKTPWITPSLLLPQGTKRRNTPEINQHNYTRMDRHNVCGRLFDLLAWRGLCQAGETCEKSLEWPRRGSPAAPPKSTEPWATGFSRWLEESGQYLRGYSYLTLYSWPLGMESFLRACNRVCSMRSLSAIFSPSSFVVRDLSSSTYPSTAGGGGGRGAPQMTSQPVSAIFLSSPPPSETWRTPGLYILWRLSPHLFFCLPCLLPHFAVCSYYF